MITFRNHLKEQMKDPKFVKAFHKEKNILAELMSMLPKERVKHANKAVKKEIAAIKHIKKKKLS